MLDIIKVNKSTNINNIIPIILVSLSMLIMLTFSDKILIKNSSKINIIKFKWNIYSQFQAFSIDFYFNHYINFIIISILLIIALIGAIVLALNDDSIIKKQKIFIQHFRNNSWT